MQWPPFALCYDRIDSRAHGDYLGACGIEPCDGLYTGDASFKSSKLASNVTVDENDWNIYPNPANDNASIDVDVFYGQEVLWPEEIANQIE